MATLPISGPLGIELDGGNDTDAVASGFENAANLTAVMATRAAGAGKDMVSKIGGNGRNAATALAAVAAVGAGVNLGAKPAIEAAGSDNRLVQFIAGTDQETIKFSDRVRPSSAAESHVEMLAENGAAEAGDKNGQVPGRR